LETSIAIFVAMSAVFDLFNQYRDYYLWSVVKPHLTTHPPGKQRVLRLMNSSFVCIGFMNMLTFSLLTVFILQGREDLSELLWSCRNIWEQARCLFAHELNNKVLLNLGKFLVCVNSQKPKEPVQPQPATSKHEAPPASPQKKNKPHAWAKGPAGAWATTTTTTGRSEGQESECKSTAASQKCEPQAAMPAKAQDSPGEEEGQASDDFVLLIRPSDTATQKPRLTLQPRQPLQPHAGGPGQGITPPANHTDTT
jgi:hypothetical protein